MGIQHIEASRRSALWKATMSIVFRAIGWNGSDRNVADVPRLEERLKVIEVPVCGQAPDAGTQALLVA